MPPKLETIIQKAAKAARAEQKRTSARAADGDAPAPDPVDHDAMEAALMAKAAAAQEDGITTFSDFYPLLTAAERSWLAAE